MAASVPVDFGFAPVGSSAVCPGSGDSSISSTAVPAAAAASADSTSSEMAKPNELPRKHVSDFPVEFGFAPISSVMPAANSDRSQMPDSDARCQVPDSSTGHARCRAVPPEDTKFGSSDVGGIRVEFGFTASSKPVNTSMQAADIISISENKARLGPTAQVESPQLKVASEAEMA